MKKILIITPHYPPSNLAAVHRARLFAQHLPEFGWEPIILTVDEKYYEEKLDWNLYKLLPFAQRIEKVGAFKITKPRFIGDIGLRAFFQLFRKAKAIISKEQIDFLYIPIPSFYIALLGRWLNKTTGVKYGIDYIDPWVHQFPGSNKMFSRHWFSTQIAKLLEPIAVKKASLITGVAEGYYQGVFERNPELKQTCLFGAMPYGGEKSDHEKLKDLQLKSYLFGKKEGKIQFVYAGAMLPKAYKPLEAIFQTIKENITSFANFEIHFIGSGKIANDPNSYNIKTLAEEYGLWNSIIFEYAQRIPYLDVLIHLKSADGVFILGSTEPHYTPSKVYQAVLSQKPIFAVLHTESTASKIITESKAGTVLTFNGENDIEKIKKDFLNMVIEYLVNNQAEQYRYDSSKIDLEIFNQYSAKSVTAQLAQLLKAIF